MNSALYIGAGTDFIPVIILKNIKNFYYIDCQPFSEHGIKTYIEHGINLFGRPKFIQELKDNAHKFGLDFKQNKDRIILSDGYNVINYMINTSMPEHKRVLQSIKDYKYLIVKGHDPHKCIVEHVSNKITFIGFHETCYYENDYDVDCIIQNLHKDSKFRERFDEFIYFDENNKKHKFITWKDFCSIANNIDII